MSCITKKKEKKFFNENIIFSLPVENRILVNWTRRKGIETGRRQKVYHNKTRSKSEGTSVTNTLIRFREVEDRHAQRFLFIFSDLFFYNAPSSS